MIDTVRFEIHGFSRRIMPQIYRSLETFSITHNSTGFVSYELIRGHLQGSWDYRISIQPRNYRYTKFSPLLQLGKHQISAAPKIIKVSCPDFLIVEFSLPKFLYGVNFFNTSLSSDIAGLSVFRSFLSSALGVAIPDFYHWLVSRLDVSTCFDFHNNENIADFISLFRNLTYPRRKRPTFWHDSLFVRGDTTTLKLYNKHAEFMVHDFQRLKSFYDYDTAKRIHDLTSGLLRFEVEYKKKKLRNLNICKVGDIIKFDWKTAMKKEFLKLIDGAKTTKTFRYNEVVRILSTSDLSRSGISMSSALAVWSTIVMNGKRDAQALFGRQKVWRACKLFSKLGINTLGRLHDPRPALKLVETDIFTHPESDTNLQDRYLKAIGQ